MIFTARPIQEKCREQNRDLYMVFIDRTKHFDTISGEALWQIHPKFGCPDKFVNINQSFHEGMAARGVGRREAVGTIWDYQRHQAGLCAGTTAF